MSDLSHRPPTGFSAAGPALAAFLVSTVVVVALAVRPADPHVAAGVFPPWWSQAAVLDAASGAGAVLAVGGLANIIVVRTTSADAARQLRQAGALFSIDPRKSLGCV